MISSRRAAIGGGSPAPRGWLGGVGKPKPKAPAEWGAVGGGWDVAVAAEGVAFSLFVSWEDGAVSEESGGSTGSEEGSGLRNRGVGWRARVCAENRGMGKSLRAA